MTIHYLTNKTFDEQLASLRKNPPELPSNFALKPWIACHALGLEYVPGGDYVFSGVGQAFSFGCGLKMLIYFGDDPMNDTYERAARIATKCEFITINDHAEMQRHLEAHLEERKKNAVH